MTEKDVLEKLLNYVKIDTQSDDDSDSFPSTDKQHDFAQILVEELNDMGISDVYYDKKYCYVYAKIPGNIPENDNTDNKVLGFIAHMDTSPDMSGKNVKPQIVFSYDGDDIYLGKCDDREYILSPKEFPELKKLIGKTLVTTDGSSLLGADDKAGVAEIMTMAQILVNNPDIKHKDIVIAFTPDEEIGAGMDHFDVKRFGADYAYTVDGGALGELEYENFNAASADINFLGRNVHPGEAKGKMINAMKLAMDFDKRLPEKERPEYTSGYEGFFHLTDMEGNVENASLHYIIRDHDKDKFENKKNIVKTLADSMNSEYKMNCVEVKINDSYYNMKEKIKNSMFLIENAKKAMEELEIEPIIQPIRGGTDGARLSFMGVPCPNLCTGGANYHGRYEYVCVEDMEKIVKFLVKLCTI